MTPEELGMTSGLIVGIVTAIKQANPPTRLLPILPIVLGEGGSYLVMGWAGRATILWGLIAGLSSMGLFSGGKTIAGK